MSLEEVTILCHRPCMRAAIDTAFRELLASRRATAVTVGEDVGGFPVLVDIARLFSRTLSPGLMSLNAAIVLARRGDTDLVMAALREGVPVYLVEDLKAEAFGHLLGVTDYPGCLYGRLSQLTARRIRESLSRRTARPALSLQEIAVLDLLKQGYSNPDIAEQLDVQVKTVKNHLTHIYAKLGVSTRYEAMAIQYEEPASAEVRLLARS